VIVSEIVSAMSIILLEHSQTLYSMRSSTLPYEF
jgi:hypothetical protein